jgi:aspartyl-tRNA(Asn)/glutamyl-tRNA(Gln) amidotransferase subunit B
MRTKEEAHDYRYFPDPDLLPLELAQDWVDGLKRALPELPDAKKTRFMRDYALDPYDADVLTAELQTAEFYEEVVEKVTSDPQVAASFGAIAEKEPVSAKMAANWVINELFGRLNQEGLRIDESRVNPYQLAMILMAIGAGAISTKTAKELFEIVWTEGGDPGEIVERRGMRQVSDQSQIQIAVDAVCLENADKVAQAKANPKLLGWFVGQVMKRTGGKANPQAVNDLLKRKLGL